MLRLVNERKDRIQNTKTRDRLQYHKDLTFIVRAKKLKYFGHIKRMDNIRYPKICLKVTSRATDTEGDRKKVAWRHQTLLWKWRYLIGGSSRTSSKKQGPMATESCWEAISRTNLWRKALSRSKSKISDYDYKASLSSTVIIIDFFYMQVFKIPLVIAPVCAFFLIQKYIA